MTNLARLLAAIAAGALASAAASQQQYPQSPEQQYPQQYPEQQYPQQSYPEQQYPQQSYPEQQYPQQQYPQQYPQTYPGYGYPQQGYGQDVVGTIIDQLLGNRFSVNDRQAVGQCARAAVAQAQYQYGYNQPYGYGQQYGYNQQYGTNQQYGYDRFRVTAITNVERRSDGLRVRGLLSSRYGGYGYPNTGYPAADLSFRCNVDHRGVVTRVRIEPYRD